jgi:hypothetical protein
MVVIFNHLRCGYFDRSDFHDFYTIKPVWVCDFGAKIYTFTLIFGVARHHLISDAHAEHAHQLLTRMLSVSIKSRHERKEFNIFNNFYST